MQVAPLGETLAAAVLPRAGRYVGLAGAAVRGDETAFRAGGRTCHTTGAAMVDERTVFEIGSVTKVFDALLLDRPGFDLLKELADAH